MSMNAEHSSADRFADLIAAVGTNNGCTVPVTYRIHSPLTVEGRRAESQAAVTNRYLSPPIESFAGYTTERGELSNDPVRHS